MSYALTRLTGDGSTQTFTIGFDYRDKADLVVKIDGVTKSLTTDYTLPTTSQISFNTAPANNAAIIIRRATSQSSRLVDYTAGAVFKESDLDTDSTQGFFMAQESIDIANDSIGKNDSNQYDAENLRVINVAEPVAGSDAATKAYVQSSAASFNSRYYGESATAPTDPTPTEGDLWWDSASNILKVHNGTGWQDATSAVATASNRASYTVGTPKTTSAGVYSGSTTVFPIVYDAGFVDVYLNGSKLIHGVDFNATSQLDNGTTITLTSAASSGDKIDLVATSATTLTNVNAVASDIANVNTVATNLTNINAVANVLPLSTNFLPLSGGDLTGNLTFGDNKRIQLGTSNDLEIYHDGSTSKIIDNGTGNLMIGGQMGVGISSPDGNTLAAFFNPALGSSLYYGGATKLGTSATGISISGGIVASGLIHTTGTLSASGYNDSNWNTAYGWGDHSQAGYLTSYTETDPVFSAHAASGVTSTKITNWDSAYNDKIASATFNTSDGVLTLNQQDGGSVTVDLDGRYGVSSGVSLADNQKATFGASDDLQIYHNGSHSYVQDNGTGHLFIKGQETIISGNTSGNWNAKFVDNGDSVFYHSTNGEKLKVTSTGIEVTGNVSLGDNDKATFGAGNDLEIYSDGATGIIQQNANGVLLLKGQDFYVQNDAGGNFLRAEAGGAVRLYHNGSGKLDTTATGIDVTGNVSLADNGKATFGASDDLQIYHDGSNSYVADAGTGDLILRGSTDIKLQSGSGALEYLSTNSSTGTIELKNSGSTKLATTSTGIDVTGNVSLNDNDKATFGAGNDLEIYHDGSNSYIDEVGTGTLRIRGHNQVRITDTSDNIAAIFKGNAESTLYNNNSAKLATTSTGIDVTGSVTADGLTVQGEAYFDTNNGSRALHVTRYGTVESESASFAIDDNDLIVDSVQDEQYGGYVFKATRNGVGTANRLDIANNGDISFYEDTGTTPKLLWDASAEQLIAKDGAFLKVTETDSSTVAAQLKSDSDEGLLQLYHNGAEKVRLRTNADSYFNGGNVGIGTSSPAELLHVHEDTTGVARMRLSNTDGYLEIGTNNQVMNLDSQTHTFRNEAGSTEYMRIDSSGNLLVGQTSTGDYTTTAGSSFRASGFSTHTRDDGDVLLLNRLTSDGAIALFRKDNTTVGSIGTKSGDLTVGTGDTGLRFDDANNAIYAHSMSANGYLDATVDLGYSGIGFKDLYLSGGIKGSTLTFSGNGSTEHVRIDSSGNVGINESSPATSLDVGGTITSDNINLGTGSVITNTGYTTPSITMKSWSNGSSTPSTHISFQQPDGTQRGKITSSIYSTVYSTSSDYRLKEDIQEVPNATSRTLALNPCNFQWIGTSERVDGFLAHEVADIVPEAIVGEKDAVDADGNPDYQSIDQSKLVPLLVKTIQELEARIATLENN